MGAEQVHPLKAASVLLQYPSLEIQAAARELSADGFARERAARGLGRFFEWYCPTPLAELQRAYVETFDFDRRASLHLTYHLHGDRRQRGMELLRLRRAYAEAGFAATDVELPDYLPLMLEFAALAPESAGRELLEQNRAAIELVRAALHEAGSPYAALLDLVGDSLGGLSRRQLARVARLAAEGPPSEEVGLEPFAPPEVMPR